jgi:hypothetical protein
VKLEDVVTDEICATLKWRLQKWLTVIMCIIKIVLFNGWKLVT